MSGKNDMKKMFFSFSKRLKVAEPRACPGHGRSDIPSAARMDTPLGPHSLLVAAPLFLFIFSCTLAAISENSSLVWSVQKHHSCFWIFLLNLQRGTGPQVTKEPQSHTPQLWRNGRDLTQVQPERPKWMFPSEDSQT